MSIETDNVAIVKRAYERWRAEKEKGFEAWLDIVSPDVQWGSITDGATGMEFTSSRSCRDDVRAYFEGLKHDWSMVDYVIEDYIAQGDRVVARGHCAWRHLGTGKIARTPKADFFKLKDGKITSFYEFFDTAKALEATIPDRR